MTFGVTHLDGGMDEDPPCEALPALLGELSGADDEHTDVSISHETGWTLSAFGDGSVIWENVEDDSIEAREIELGDSQAVLRLFEAVARSDLATVEAQDWETQR